MISHALFSSQTYLCSPMFANIRLLLLFAFDYHPLSSNALIFFTDIFHLVIAVFLGYIQCLPRSVLSEVQYGRAIIQASFSNSTLAFLKIRTLRTLLCQGF